jgi:hypothetical protein
MDGPWRAALRSRDLLSAFTTCSKRPVCKPGARPASSRAAGISYLRSRSNLNEPQAVHVLARHAYHRCSQDALVRICPPRPFPPPTPMARSPPPPFLSHLHPRSSAHLLHGPQSQLGVFGLVYRHCRARFAAPPGSSLSRASTVRA